MLLFLKIEKKRIFFLKMDKLILGILKMFFFLSE